MQDWVIRDAEVLTADGTFVRADVAVAGGRIAGDGGIGRVGAAPTGAAAGLRLLPGAIDVHGDAFERQLMPRPGVRIPHDVALAETDRQLAANGITTAYHGLTVSWEPGLRSLAEGEAFRAALAAARPHLAVEHRLQVRWETFALEAADAIAGWLGDEPAPALAFNDHTGPTMAKIAAGQHAKLGQWAERAGLGAADYVALAAAQWERRGEVDDAIGRMAAVARRHGATMLSHDDADRETRARFRGLGATVAEFPLDRRVAEDARTAGENVVLGAPNVVRGGSHTGALHAADAVADGLCTVLASDYYYPALGHAAARLAHERRVPLARAWALVSSHAADAMGLADRGRIEPGRRADLVLADWSDPAHPRIVATFVAGRPVHQARPLAAAA